MNDHQGLRGIARIGNLVQKPRDGEAVIGDRPGSGRIRLAANVEYNIYDLGDIPGGDVINNVTQVAYDARFAVGSITFELRSTLSVDTVRGRILASTVPNMLDLQSRTDVGSLFPIIQGKTTLITVDLTGGMFPFFGVATSTLAGMSGGVAVKVRAQEWVNTETT